MAVLDRFRADRSRRHRDRGALPGSGCTPPPAWPRQAPTSRSWPAVRASSRPRASRSRPRLAAPPRGDRRRGRPGHRDPGAFAGASTEAFGLFYVLLNNAGIGTAVPATRETPEQFRHGPRRQPRGLVLVRAGLRARHAAGVLDHQRLQRPRVHHRRPSPGGLRLLQGRRSSGLTRDLAAQWTGRKGIRVNAIAPGFFESEMTDEYPDGYLEQTMGRVPAGRSGGHRPSSSAPWCSWPPTPPATSPASRCPSTAAR